MSDTMKRSRFDLEAGEIERQAMANCLMLLSQFGRESNNAAPSALGERKFTCKTCNRQFPSFQALGGHRASHKKAKPTSSSSGDHSTSGGGDSTLTSVSAKPKTHDCSICGLEFPIGQALGGHMRRHRALISGGTAPAPAPAVKKEGDEDKESHDETSAPLPVLKKANGKRVCFGSDFDLNSPPAMAWEDGISSDALMLRLGPATSPMIAFNLRS